MSVLLGFLVGIVVGVIVRAISASVDFLAAADTLLGFVAFLIAWWAAYKEFSRRGW